MNSASPDIPALYRKEFTKMVAVLARTFGFANIALAEDLVSDTFMAATEAWQRKGPPQQPEAWLYAAAKKKALEYLRRDKTFKEKIRPHLSLEQPLQQIDFSEHAIQDSQLRMLFAVCDPAIAAEAQIALALRVLCGFTIDEIAHAFLTNKEAVNKRLFRAKERLRLTGLDMDLHAGQQLTHRLDNVLHIIYLLFNEGYASTRADSILRKDLCLEAMRLGLLLTQNASTAVPKTFALLALMCFHASRFSAREGIDGSQILFDRQDRTKWDQALIAKGEDFLQRSAQGHEVSSFHMEAAIARCHCLISDEAERWQKVLGLYDRLLMVNYSPSVALNRTYALYKVKGSEVALAEALKLQLLHNHHYFVLLAELYAHTDKSKAKEYLLKAHAMTSSPSDRQLIEEKIKSLAD
ncbi:MAG: sigma-70 family RNA polymerase sigma factor [Chitinophagales bacterium]|nr:sigma-70 family RNA polymerase sigma factor [Chitinophagales bacterium]